MLGFYKNFPQQVHKITHFSTSVSNKKLQQALVQTFHKINGQTFKLNEITNPSIPQCNAVLEFGIAEEESFNYLDLEETNKVLETIRKKPLQIMDLFCAIRYYKMKGESISPLKFDYYMLRLIFDENFMEMQIFHERGPRHVLPEEISNLIVKKVNESFTKKFLKPMQT